MIGVRDGSEQLAEGKQFTMFSYVPDTKRFAHTIF